MFEAIRRLLWDEAYFAQHARAASMLLGTMLTSGVITLNDLGEQFGRVGWYVGLTLQAASVFVRAGEKNEPTK